LHFYKTWNWNNHQEKNMLWLHFFCYHVSFTMFLFQSWIIRPNQLVHRKTSILVWYHIYLILLYLKVCVMLLDLVFRMLSTFIYFYIFLFQQRMFGESVCHIFLTIMKVLCVTFWVLFKFQLASPIFLTIMNRDGSRYKFWCGQNFKEKMNYINKL
jgi:hypothetical protein